MTPPLTPEALAEAPYVLLKRGLFYGPNNQGYTGVLRKAGRYTCEDAEARVDHCAPAVTMMLASEAPAYSPACWHETQVEDLLDLLRIEREAKEAALAAHQQVTAERDEARAKQRDMHRRAQKAESFRERHRGGFRWLFASKRKERTARRIADAALATASAELARLRAEVEALKEDAARLDFLDGCNARLNASYGTHYGWKLVLNHNVNRLVLGDMKVDLHDSEGGNDKLPSCRLAIDEARKRTALARAATAREGQADE